MALARARRDSGMNYWPGFVDALSTLVLSIIFLLSIFVIVQFYLTQEVTGKDTALSRLTAQIAQLTELLSLEKTGKLDLEEQLTLMRSSLARAEGERDRYKGLFEGTGSGEGKATELSGQLDAERRLSARALAQVEVLNQQIAALRRQLSALEEALDASEKRDKEAQNRIADLGQRLNVALAQRVQELSRYRSDFFGRLRAILGNRPDIRIVGDRFVFQSEVFFDTARSEEHTSELQSLRHLVCRLLLEKINAKSIEEANGPELRPPGRPAIATPKFCRHARAKALSAEPLDRPVTVRRLIAASTREGRDC